MLWEAAEHVWCVARTSKRAGSFQPKITLGLHTCEVSTAVAKAGRENCQGCGTACAQFAQSGHMPLSLLSYDTFAGRQISSN